MQNPTSLHASNSTINVHSRIDNHHFQEWLSSGVSEQITTLNVVSIHDSYELDKILNRNIKNRRKHSDNLIPAWCVSGIDPQGWERTLAGVQVKPDNPAIINGKPQKYLSSSGYGVSPLFLDTGIPDYWLKIIENKSIPIIIVEGAKKAGAVLTLGIAAISILVGTSNEEEILNDPTGSRRFWIIPVKTQSIPLDLLEKESKRSKSQPKKLAIA